MKIAMPTKQEHICKNFSGSEEFTIYDVEIELVQSKEILPIPPEKSLSDFLFSQDVNVIICKNISGDEKSALRAKRMEFIWGVEGTADEVLIRFLSGERLGRGETEPSTASMPLKQVFPI